MSFRLIDESPCAPEGGDAEIRRLRRQMESGTAPDKEAALARLIALGAENVLTDLLGSRDEQVAQLATTGLWECWLNEAGPAARRKIDQGIELLNQGDPAAALDVFTRLVKEFPRWAEALNKQATALYLLGNARLSLKVCRLVVELKPNHFGAWNGMALCAAQLGKWPAVLEAAREALRLQPEAKANLDLIQLAQARLREGD